MTNDDSPDTAKDVPRVDIRSDENVRYWCEKWTVTPAQLRGAVAKVGDEAPAVAFALGREAW